MKVLLFANRFAFEYSIELANSLSKTKDIKKVILMLPGNYLDKIQQKQISSSVEFIPFELANDANIIKSLMMIRKIKEVIRKERPDIFHIQGSGHFYFFLLFPFIKSIPIIDTIHDAKPHPGYNRLRQIFMRWNAPRYTEHWFTHGESIKKIMKKIYNIQDHRIHVIPKGHYSIFNKYSNKTYKEVRNTVLFFGNITKYKGLEYLIKSESIVSKKVPNLKIIIAGKIATSRKTKESFDKYKKIMTNIDNFIIMNYLIPNDKIRKLFQEASVIVLPYIEASQSGVLSIALGFGKPVIVTNVGALPEVVQNGKTGLIIPPRDPLALARAITLLLKNDKLRKSMGKNAYEYAMNELSWDEVARKTLSVYNKTLQNKGGLPYKKR